MSVVTGMGTKFLDCIFVSIDVLVNSVCGLYILMFRCNLVSDFVSANDNAAFISHNVNEWVVISI